MALTNTSNNNKIVITDFDNDNTYETSTRHSTKSVVPTSVFDGANVSTPGTPETSIASASLFPASTYSNNYTYNNPVQNSYNQSVTFSNNTNHNYTRSIATSTINNNDSSSIITLASSTRNLLNRSKSARRSIETFNSSTIGIPPSSIFERLNYTHGSSNANVNAATVAAATAAAAATASGNNGTNTNMNSHSGTVANSINNVINEDLNVEFDLQDAEERGIILDNDDHNADEDNDTEDENDDIYSLNNSLRTHYSSAYNRLGNDSNSFKSLKTGRLSAKSFNSVNE